MSNANVFLNLTKSVSDCVHIIWYQINIIITSIAIPIISSFETFVEDGPIYGGLETWGFEHYFREGIQLLL